MLSATGLPISVFPYAAYMGPVAIIPVKSFVFAKQRLAPALDDQGRAGLGRALASHVAGVAEKAGLLPIFVTGDPEVATWATGLGFPSVPEQGEGLDNAAASGVGWAVQSKSPWLVLHSDLPLLTAGDLAALSEAIGNGHDVVAPSSDGGTSAIGSSGGSIAFSFGPGSFSRHLARLDEPRVFTSVGLLHDLDTPADARSAAAHSRGEWLASYIG